jgi:hypothetical protein
LPRTIRTVGQSAGSFLRGVGKVGKGTTEGENLLTKFGESGLRPKTGEDMYVDRHPMMIAHPPETAGFPGKWRQMSPLPRHFRIQVWRAR